MVSTTNKATDNVAVKIGKAARTRSVENLEDIIRIGSGADERLFRSEGLQTLLTRNQKELRNTLSQLKLEYEKAKTPEERRHISAYRTNQTRTHWHTFGVS